MNEQDEKYKQRNEQEGVMLAALEGVAKYAKVKYTVSRGSVVVDRRVDAALISGMCASVGLDVVYTVRKCNGDKLYFLSINPI